MGSLCRNSARDMHACPSGLLALRTGWLVGGFWAVRAQRVPIKLCHFRVRVGVDLSMLVTLCFCQKWSCGILPVLVGSIVVTVGEFDI